MIALSTAGAWRAAGPEIWRYDEDWRIGPRAQLLPLRATFLWTAPVAKATLRVRDAAGEGIRPGRLRRNCAIFDLPPPGRAFEILLEASAPPDLATFHPEPDAPVGNSGAGVFPRCLTSRHETAERPAFDPALLDEALDAGEINRALEIFGGLCLAENRDDIVLATRRIAVHLARYPLLRTDRVGMFAAALATVRS